MATGLLLMLISNTRLLQGQYQKPNDLVATRLLPMIVLEGAMIWWPLDH